MKKDWQRKWRGISQSRNQQPQVTGIQWLNNDDTTKDILLSIEKQSEHPLAETVVKHLKGGTTIPLSKFDSITGKGAKAVHNSETYFAGNKKLLAENNIAIADQPPLRTIR